MKATGREWVCENTTAILCSLVTSSQSWRLHGEPGRGVFWIQRCVCTVLQTSALELLFLLILNSLCFAFSAEHWRADLAPFVHWYAASLTFWCCADSSQSVSSSNCSKVRTRTAWLLEAAGSLNPKEGLRLISTQHACTGLGKATEKYLEV